MLTPHPLYLALSDAEPERRMAYTELFRGYLDNETLNDIREALNHERVLGRSYFNEKIEQMTQRQTTLGKPGRPCVEQELGYYFVD